MGGYVPVSKARLQLCHESAGSWAGELPRYARTRAFGGGCTSASGATPRTTARLIPVVRRRLAAVPTRLTAVPDDLQEQLISCGDAICDTGPRMHLRPGTARANFPTRDDP